MNFRFITGFIIASLVQSLAMGQSDTYFIKKVTFSSDKYDEFSPVYYKNQIVFSTNRNNGSFSSYYDNLNKGLFKIYSADTSVNEGWRKSKLFSRNLKTRFNDGPVTFSQSGDTIYYSRNINVDGKLPKQSEGNNTLGIFSAINTGKHWTKIREIRFNSEYYNITTPCLSPDDNRLFFASDKPGGIGGSDLYYCQKRGDFWDNPVNLGPEINTKGNESYPFINAAGELFFSSDGHPGLGGKDIFYSRQMDNKWLAPVRLDPPVNSKYDDFGLITDTLITEGYFSSGRDKSIDIYHFKTINPQIFYSTIQKENQYCFKFNDNGEIAIDTLYLKYVWDFGDGGKATGSVVNHCFPGPGKYKVRLDIIDKAKGILFFAKLAYEVDLKDYEQAYIKSQDIAVKGDSQEFDGRESYLPGYQIINYSWDFDDGTRGQGESTKHSFSDIGEYLVNLRLTLKSGSTGNLVRTSSSKRILILDNKLELEAFKRKSIPAKPQLTDIRRYSNAKIIPYFSAETEFEQNAVFQVELLSSNNKLGASNKIFQNVPDKYMIKEILNQGTGDYGYVTDQQMNIMATYLTFRRMVDYGFKNAVTKIMVLKDPAAQELNNLLRIFGNSTDSYFDKNNRLTSTGYLILDQIVNLMTKYPELKLEVGVHTDNKVFTEQSLTLSLSYAKVITNYLINKGLNSRRLVAKGFGDTKPVAPNNLEKDRSLNRHVDFTIIE